MSSPVHPLLPFKEDLTDETFETVWLRSRRTSLFRAFLNEFTKKHVQIVSANGWPQEVTSIDAGVDHLSIEIRSGATSVRAPSWIYVCASDTLDPDKVLTALHRNFPDCANVHVTTTYQGVTSDAGFKVTKCVDGVTRALSLLAVYDPLGTFVTLGFAEPPKGQELGDEFFRSLDAAYMQLRAKANDLMLDHTADDKGYPCLEPLSEQLNILMTPFFGNEEQWLHGIYKWGHQRFRKTIPVTGGSAGDEAFVGTWRTYCRQNDGNCKAYDEKIGPGCVFTLIGASVKVFPCYMHAFTPIPDLVATIVSCGSSGVEKGETHGRFIHRLKDSEGTVHPAGALYRRWIEERVQKNFMPEPKVLSKAVAYDGEVIGRAGIAPFGVNVAHDGDDAFDYRLVCPTGIYYFKEHEAKKGDSYLQVASNVTVGEAVTLFKVGRRGDFLHRLGKLKEQLVAQIDRGGSSSESVALSPDTLRLRVAGGIVVYCAGCTIQVNCGKDGAEQMRRLTMGISNCFGGQPWTAMHAMSEQMYYPSTQEVHQCNLSFTILVFSKDPCFEVDECRSFADMISPIIRLFGNGLGKDIVCDVLHSLLVNGSNCNFDILPAILSTNAITPKLLQDITPCCSKPLVFASRCAVVFHSMALRHPLKAREYHMAEAWFKKFGQDFLNAAPMFLIAKGNVLDTSTVRLCVLMAMRIDAKAVVATSRFQELMDEVWTHSPDPEQAMRTLVTDVGTVVRPGRWSAKWRHWANAMSYCCLTALQAWTSAYCSDSLCHWLVILIWSFSNMVQTMASPTTGYYTLLTTLDDVVLVFMHLGIVLSVLRGHDVPRDLDSLSMILHFGNLLKLIVPQPTIGPLIILVITMMADIAKVMFLLVFFASGLYLAFCALFRDVTGKLVGEEWTSPGVILVNAMVGPQLMWATDFPGKNSLFFSWLFGYTDAHALDVVGGCLIGLTVFLVPILLLNMLVAMMASSYQEVSMNADSEYKRTFAACVLVAHELSPLPMPFSLPVDLLRLIRKLCVGEDKDLKFNCECGKADDDSDVQEKQSRERVAVTQLLQLWETYVTMEQAKAGVTIEQDQRMRNRMDGLQDRLNVVYNALLNLSIHVDKIEGRQLKGR